MTQLDEFRAEKDSFFSINPESPLTAEQKHNFAGLRYFPENPALRLEVAVEELPGREQIQMQTSTGDIQTYFRHGRIRFPVEGRQAELTIYGSAHGYFLPFVDSLAGKETYPAGRYLDPRPLQGGRFLVDFNFAYNPYCAYNENWSCPLTPPENRLMVPIRAGEKLYDDPH
ncbi:MAG: DUF1684 domain-containing protein [Anaerolineales bacterium]|jgi:uncharacterized protein (DUF1684 family)